MIVGGLWYDFNEHGDDDDDLKKASRDYWETVYYVLDLNTGEVSSLPRAVVDDGCLPCVGVVGSRLYLFGDAKTKPKKKKRKNKQQPLFSSQMLHLTKPQNGWTLAAAGLDHLLPIDLVVFGGKIYVFGNSDDGFICEVFDPQRHKCCRLKSPPFPPAPKRYDRHLTLPVMADYKRNRIIVYFQYISTMYAYYPCEDQWRCMVEGFNGWYTGGQPVTFAADDGVIYIHSRRLKNTFFRAYDTVTKQWLNVRPSPEAEAEAEAKGHYESYLKYEEYRDLLYRGNGLLCLLTSFISDLTFVHLVQFKVELVKLGDDSKEVLVTPHSS